MTKGMGEGTGRSTFAVARPVTRLVGAGVVVIAFIVVVLTAVAQQEVLDILAKDPSNLGYSSAYASFDEIDGRRSELYGLRLQEAEDLREIKMADERVRQANAIFDDDWSDFDALASQIRQSGKCDLHATQTGSLSERLEIWRDAKRCAVSGSLPLALEQRLQGFMAGSANLDRVALRLSAASLADQDANEHLGEVKDSIKAAVTLSPDEQKTMRMFSETNVLRKNWLLGGHMLLQFPPPMLQILLAFASGMFGALLVTVVLVVYPNTNLSLSGSTRVGPRIMLGGMIAMCVYIVLLGGTAVLGSSSGITAAGTNYMAFCAIGILAGMFSYRVAFWLSDRANAFFKLNPADEPAPVTPPLPPKVV